jgi:nitrite reductase/ring-hydroxylating ferredoxin subunit
VTASPPRRTRRHLLGLAVAGVAAFCAGPAPALARPTIVAGDPCKKAGRTRTAGAKTFTCTERDGALVWVRTKAKTGGSGSGGAKSPATSGAVRAMASSDLVIGTPRLVVVTGEDGTKRYVGFSRTASGVVAFEPKCTHQGYQLEVQGDRWYCDYHGSAFAGATGEVLAGPASTALRRYTASESGGSVIVTF